MNNRIKSFITVLAILISVLTINGTVFAAANEVGFETLLNGSPATTVFVGEVIKTNLYVQNFEEFSNCDFAIHFNPAVVKLVSFVDNSTIVTDGLKAKNSFFEGQPNINGIYVPNSFLDNWAGGVGDIMSSAVRPYVGNSNGTVKFSITASSKSALAAKTAILKMNFIAVGEGNPDIRFAVAADGEGNFDTELPIGAKFYYGTEIALSQVAQQNVIVKVAPDTPAGLAWDAGVGALASWTDQVSRGYEVIMYNGATAVSTQNLPVGTTQFDFAPFVTTPGDYTFTVKAKGATNDSAVATSAVKPAPATPTGLIWDATVNTTSKWDNQVSTGYEVILYNGATVVSTQSIAAGVSQFDFAGNFTTPGDYTFTVKAKGTTNNSAVATSPIKTVTIPLATPATPVWTGTTLSWPAVANASKYSIDLYKDNVLEKTIVVNASEVPKDLATDLVLGAYTAEVTALGENGYTPSAASPLSLPYYAGAKISGYVKMEAAPANKQGGVILDLKQAGVTKFSITSNNDGSFSLLSIPAGTYDIVITNHNAGVLKRTLKSVVLADQENKVLSTQAAPILLLQGDVSFAGVQNNIVYGEDYGALTPILGSVQGTHPAYSALLDFNMDGKNTIEDITIIVRNYDKASEGIQQATEYK